MIRKKICNEYAHQVNYREEIRPIFYSNNQDFVITLYNLNYGIKGDDDNKQSSKGSNISQEMPQIASNCPKLPQIAPNLSYNLDRFLQVLKNFPGGTIKLLSHEANIGERTVKLYLQQLKEANLIRRVGTNRKGYWKISIPVTEEN